MPVLRITITFLRLFLFSFYLFFHSPPLNAPRHLYLYLYLFLKQKNTRFMRATKHALLM